MHALAVPVRDKARGGDRRGTDPRRSSSESDRPRRPARTEDSGGYESPWKTVSRAPQEEPAFDHGGISGKSFIDPEQLRRQRAEETRVYGENACKALFASRPDAIVRAWFVQSVTPRFREALRWMAANRKAYHVVDEEELAKASGTEHHGGVCFLIKKRQVWMRRLTCRMLRPKIACWHWKKWATHTTWVRSFVLVLTLA
ncbi:putative methyltransferase [Serratia fonticola]|uniref:Putative methyltransferase n=1 Tax=Serratia fonticola TaxID=47917 RepID=A0A4U9TV67_SERFO|nr:putative methyltransferase [Serratia fonticola]